MFRSSRGTRQCDVINRRYFLNFQQHVFFVPTKYVFPHVLKLISAEVTIRVDLQNMSLTRTIRALKHVFSLCHQYEIRSVNDIEIANSPVFSTHIETGLETDPKVTSPKSKLDLSSAIDGFFSTETQGTENGIDASDGFKRENGSSFSALL